MIDMDDPKLSELLERDLGKARVWCRSTFPHALDLVLVGYAGVCICGDLSMRASFRSDPAQDDCGAQIATAQQVLDALGYGPCTDHGGGQHRGLVLIEPARFSAHAKIRVVTEIRALLPPHQASR